MEFGSVKSSVSVKFRFNRSPKQTYSFQVRFTDALDLVRGRKVYLRGGNCFVPISDLQHLLVFRFKTLLTQNVAKTAKILPNLDEDDRLVKMLSELDKRYTGADYTDNANSDTIRYCELLQF